MSNEIILETVRELLPEIETQIRQQVLAELQTEYSQRFQEAIDQLTNEEEIRIELEKQIRSDYEQQKEQLAQDVIREFDDSLQRGQLEQQLRFKIQEELEQQINEEVLKKQKAIKLQYKKRLENEKSQLQRDFELEWKQRVDAEKKRLEREKSEIARLKSVECIKLKKLQDQQKQHQQLLKDQESKYQEIMRSLQKQIQELTQQLESALQNQVVSEQLKIQENQQYDSLEQSKIINMPCQIIQPIYQHNQITESDEPSLDNQINIKQYHDKPTKHKQQQNLYLNELNKPKKQSFQPTQQATKQIDQENNKKKMNRIDTIIKEYEEPPTQPQPNYLSYNSQFKENDLDNTKNKQMKQKRQSLMDKMETDQKLQTKYLGIQINTMNDFIVDYVEHGEYHQVKLLLQQLIEYYNTWMISNQERIEFLKQFKNVANTNFRDSIPLLQTQIHKFKLLQPYYNDFQRRFQIKSQIMQNCTLFSKCKHLFDELNQLKLGSINLSIQGCDFQEILNMDQWEREFLEREELKSQILCKIQSKLI